MPFMGFCDKIAVCKAFICLWLNVEPLQGLTDVANAKTCFFMGTIVSLTQEDLQGLRTVAGGTRATAPFKESFLTWPFVVARNLCQFWKFSAISSLSLGDYSHLCTFS